RDARRPRAVDRRSTRACGRRARAGRRRARAGRHQFPQPTAGDVMRLSMITWRPLAVFALTVALSACGNLHGRPTVERKARPITASRPTATEAMEPDTVVSPGIVEPWGAQVDLSAQESGWIAQIHVKEGDVVQSGQLLATLEDTAQRRGVELAKA